MGVGVLLAGAQAFAGEPRLDELAAARGIAAGELEVGARVAVPAPRTRGPSARAERRSLSLHGLPVRGAFETSWITPSAQGPARERVIASAYPSRDAQLRPEQARVDRGQARQALGAHLRPEQLARLDGEGAYAGFEGELVYLMLAETPLLAWEFTAPLSRTPYPSRERLWVSARTGQVLDAVELVDEERLAEVFEVNPKHTPTPSTVTLSNIDPEQVSWVDETPLDGVYLTSARVRVFNCIDEDSDASAPWREEPEEGDRIGCFPTQQVAADAEGDFFVPLPEVVHAAENIDPTDLYAELSMYYHAEKFFDFMATKGVEDFPCERANMVANFHYLDPAPLFPELSYGPLNNAYYSGECDIEDGPTMVFGQGSAVDFGYDGDVIYHELGHGVVAQLTPEGLRGRHKRSDGVLRDARAVNESIADYHTIMVTERPELADYAGFYWPELDRAWIRNAENEKSCPATMAGQEHNDGEPLTAALWATRYRVGADKLDPVVLAALPLLASDTTLEQTAAALMEVAQAELDAGVWTSEDVAILERALAARNLFDCERVIDDPISLDTARFMYVEGNGKFISPFWPGPVQYRQVIPAGSDNLLISFDAQGRGNSTGMPVNYEVEPLLLVKRSSLSEDAPMHYEFELAALGYEDEEDEDIDKTWEVTGDWDVIHVPTRLGLKRRQVLLRGLEPGEVVHVTFAASDSETTVIRELFFSSIPSEELDEGSPEQDPSADPEILDDGSSCACTSTKEGGSGGLALGLFALVAIARRRSRTW